MSKSFSKVVEDCISEFMKTECFYNFSDGKIDIRDIARENRFLPILLDWSGFYALYPTGEIIVYDFENPNQLQVETNQRIRNIAITRGIERFPSLSPYLPRRTADDLDCPSCESHKETIKKLPEHIRNGISCYCGGLGWIPKE